MDKVQGQVNRYDWRDIPGGERSSESKTSQELYPSAIGESTSY